MRQKFEQDFLGRPALRVQWLCLIADRLLGRSDLSDFEMLTAGFRSVTAHPDVHAAERALRNLRVIGIDVATRRGVYNAVSDCLEWERTDRDKSDEEPPYEIEPTAPYRFKLRLDDRAPILRKMLEYIDSALPYEPNSMSYMDPSRPARVVLDQEASLSATVDLKDVTEKIPGRKTHDRDRRSRGPVTIPVAELIKLAGDLDKMDEEEGNRNRAKWTVRLLQETGDRKFHILVRGTEKLEEQNKIRLDGLQHMIGLPGSGKTTLVQLMLIWLDRKGYRAAVLLPSIESSLNMIDVLRRYGASAGLLVGQSPSTRRRHANKLAERIASQDAAKGYGRSGPGAEFLALNCPLDAFREDDSLHAPDFPHLNPPCSELKQRKLRKDGTPAKTETTVLCPVSSWCARMAAPRGLTEANIWIGHIISTFPRIAPHFLQQQERLRYFDYLARHMDIIVVDEADGAQANLDENAIVELDLTGSPESLEFNLISDVLAPTASGQTTKMPSSVLNYHFAATNFSNLNVYLRDLIQAAAQKKQQQADSILATYKGRFTTSATVLSELYRPDKFWKLSEAQRDIVDERIDRMREWWDSLVQAANRHPDDEEHQTVDVERLAHAIGLDSEKVAAVSAQLESRVRDFITSQKQHLKERFVADARAIMFELIPPASHLTDQSKKDHFGMLIGVTTVVLQYISIAWYQQAMVAAGIHDTPLGDGGVPHELARLLPEALIGRLAGVRISVENVEGKDQVRLQYVNFRSAPRMLLYRWHDLHREEDPDFRGPNVLLTSATSFLEESPSYHIAVGPDYILCRTEAQDEWKKSVFQFNPIPDSKNLGEKIFFSGAKGPLSRRPEILTRMIEHYYRGSPSLLDKMLQDFAPGRKVAFVVNSYEQVRWIKQHLAEHHRSIHKRTIGVTNIAPEDAEHDWIVASQVEVIGGRDDWDSIVFPMRALSRGVNIVFPDGPHKDDAVLGTIVFLTRPHPASDNLSFATGLVGQATQRVDWDDSLATRKSIKAVNQAWANERSETLRTIRRILQTPITMNRLGPQVEPFVADTMIEILQTIGRAMRNGVKARVIFADAAWAPGSSRGGTDTARSSMLVAIRRILHRRIHDARHPVDAEVYKAMYEPFLLPLSQCVGLSEEEHKDYGEVA